jgi:hypothetical protein
MTIVTVRSCRSGISRYGGNGFFYDFLILIDYRNARLSRASLRCSFNARPGVATFRDQYEKKHSAKIKNGPDRHEASCWKVQCFRFIWSAANIPFSLTLTAGRRL